MIGLTPRQAQLLRYLTGYAEAHGRAPAYSEIRAAMQLRGGALSQLVHRLADRGAIRIQPGRAGHGRAIEVLHPLPIPRTPGGAPLYLVELGRAS